MLISELPEGLRQLAEQRFIEYFAGLGERWLAAELTAEVGNFVWERTEEGHRFWSKVNRGDFSGYTPPEPMYNNYTE